MRGSKSLCEQQRICPSINLRMTRASFFPEMVTHGFNSAEIRVSNWFQATSWWFVVQNPFVPRRCRVTLSCCASSHRWRLAPSASIADACALENRLETHTAAPYLAPLAIRCVFHPNIATHSSSNPPLIPIETHHSKPLCTSIPHLTMSVAQGRMADLPG